MSRKVLGMILAILGAIALMINISFFKEMEWFHTVRGISCAVFLIGVVMIPNDVQPKSNIWSSTLKRKATRCFPLISTLVLHNF